MQNAALPQLHNKLVFNTNATQLQSFSSCLHYFLAFQYFTVESKFQMFKVLTFKHILSPHKLYSITKRFVSFQLDAKDTIYALSSGPITKSGVSVIRISGSSALKCAQTLCQKKADNQRPLFRERVATLRHLYCPKSRDVLDQSLVLWFPAPRSFTGEDVVELHVHGSRAVVIGIMESLEYLDSIFRNNNNNGIRPAERGEFTRRAFENGRMDLTEVEGLSDLLEAETAQQRKQALLQMDGHQRKIYEAWR
jgi:tRNA modification GTPase